MQPEMREVAGGLAECRGPSEIGRWVLAVARKRVGISGLNFMPLCAPVALPDDLVLYNAEVPVETMKEQMFANLPHTLRDTGSLEALCSRGVVDFAERLDDPVFRHSVTFNDFWRTCRIERQLVAFLSIHQRPIGVVGLTRSLRETPFTHEQFRWLASLAPLLAHALTAHSAFGGSSSQGALEALASALPMVCASFDAAGRVVWLSDEALVQLSVCSAKMGSTRFIGEANDLLEALDAMARRALRNPGQAASSLLDTRSEWRALGVPFARSVDTGYGSAQVVVGFQPSPPGASRASATATDLDLTPRQAEVAQLAIQGHSVASIAERLLVSQNTVKTHLKAIYLRHGVMNRTELAYRLSRN